ncbi:MAG: putative Na+/H+ antiporter [Simkaniaceae bacterium]|nr:putative Na+/H+ antiporter [Candidatus Sacchlamyda saccharinae]
MTLEELLSSEVAAATPFRVLTLVIFLAAITHTLLAHHFTALAKKVSKKEGDSASILAEVLYFLGEIEIVFALWVIPLVIAATAFFGFTEMIQYLNSRIYIEPFFIVVVMSLSSSRPIFKLAEKGVRSVGKFFGNSAESWWLATLTLGPILGSLITEAAAMTICVLLLRKRIYTRHPSNRLAYGTMGLMFVNFSVGGVLTNFATPPALSLSRCWNWDVFDFFSQFGWRVVIGILLVNLLYFTFLRKDFRALTQITHKEEERREADQNKGPVPVWITCIHLGFLAWTIAMAHYLPIFFGSYLLYLGFHQATRMHQYRINLKRPLMVGLFLAGLVIHGGFQGWWIEPLIGNLGYGAMMVTGTVLTAFNENTTVAYLACLLDDLQPHIQYALVSGLVAGGGLTIMAHAPNPAGQALLRPYFRKGISPFKLFLAALGPTLIFLLIFFVFPSAPSN